MNLLDFVASQFKSVIEEDDEDIDEDDVGDEELAQLVAMAKEHTESEGDTDTETEPPEGERGAAVGSDSLSEASSNTPLHVSELQYVTVSLIVNKDTPKNSMTILGVLKTKNKYVDNYKIYVHMNMQ